METGQVGVIEKTIKIINKYGIFKIVEALVVITAFLYIVHNVSNIPRIVDSVFRNRTERIQIEHDAAVEARRNIRPEIDDILKRTISYLNADRIFIIEMHNGTNNTAGLPFIYGEMTYEEVKNGITHIDEDYTSVNLSRFEFPMFLRQNRVFIGSIDELRKIDDKLATRMSSNDVTYFGIISMHGITNELGYFGVSYCNGNKPASVENIIEQMTICSQKLSILLDSSNIESD